MNEDAPLLAQVGFGLNVENFVHSEIGQYLLGRADQEVATAIAKLKKANPNDAEEIRDLQNQIYRAESINGWLAEAVLNGQHAERTLTGE